jgi:hypothetical protein
VLLQLNGNHRFRNDEEWGHILQMFRRHGPNQHQVDRINERVVTPTGIDGPSEMQHMRLPQTSIGMLSTMGSLQNTLRAHTTLRSLHLLVATRSLCIRSSLERAISSGKNQANRESTYHSTAWEKTFLFLIVGMHIYRKPEVAAESTLS